MKLSKKQREQIDAKRALRTLLKTQAIVFAVATAVSLTGCGFTFEKNVKDPSVIEQFTQDISTTAESFDWDKIAKDEKETLSDFKDKITEKATEFAAENELGSFEIASLVRVVDGDTIVVELSNGEEAVVRLIGIDTPESVASEEYLARTGKENTQAGADASAYTKELLADTTTLYLQKDTSDVDQYGRLLRYVWMEIPNDTDSLTEIATKMLNGRLVKDHIANVVEYEPDTAHAKDFQEIYDADYDAYE